MANALDQNPLILDSANTSTVLSANKYRVNHIEWVDPSTAGHECSLRDKNGKVVFSAFATADNMTFPCPIKDFDLNGIIMHTLASGKVYIYYQ